MSVPSVFNKRKHPEIQHKHGERFFKRIQLSYKTKLNVKVKRESSEKCINKQN